MHKYWVQCLERKVKIENRYEVNVDGAKDESGSVQQDDDNEVIFIDSVLIFEVFMLKIHNFRHVLQLERYVFRFFISVFYLF